MRLRKQQRLMLVVVALMLLGGATALVLTALSDSVALFVMPSDIAEGKIEADKTFRLGGVVVEGSVARQSNDGVVTFNLTDNGGTVPVSYQGILPDLFREGQGIVAQGRLNQKGVFVASEVLAKHDENYMPKEVADALKANGMWQHGENRAAATGAKEASR